MNKAISPDVARNTVAALKQYGTPERTLSQVRVGLTAIRPYSDRASERVEDLLVFICRSEGDRRSRLLAQLETIAGQPVTV